jgi:hypothetical protein
MKKEKFIYLIAISETDKSVEYFNTPEKWISESERQGLVYSLKGFIHAFNSDQINCDNCFMQIY